MLTFINCYNWLQYALQQKQQANPHNQGNGQGEGRRLTVQVTPMQASSRPSNPDTSSSVPETRRTSAQDADVPKTLQLPNPEYVVYTERCWSKLESSILKDCVPEKKDADFLKNYAVG